MGSFSSLDLDVRRLITSEFLERSLQSLKFFLYGIWNDFWLIGQNTDMLTISFPPIIQHLSQIFDRPCMCTTS